ncbi:MAG: hypothetical protein SWK76_16790 [Actinomycetota bacterium]|nr:hypothetical protein [Actinomycetota bacterium]
MKTRPCSDCGVPEAIGRKYTWNVDGTITEKDSPERRVVILETDNLAMLFGIIGEEKQTSLDSIIVDAKRRSATHYMQSMFGELSVQAMQFLGMHPVFRYLSDRALVLGYGKIKIVKVKRLRSAEIKVSWPHFQPISLGDFAAASQVSLRGPVKIAWEPLEQNRYIYRAAASHLERSSDDKASIPVSPRLPGDIEYKMCDRCDVPLEIARYQWNMEKGIITDPLTAHRITICEVRDMESVLAGIERELGNDLSDLFVSAQRQFVKSSFSQEEMRMSQQGYRRLLSLRGLGYLRDFEFDSTRMYMRIDNPALPRILAGSVAAFYEMSTGDHGEVRWQVENENSLVVTVERTSGTII